MEASNIQLAKSFSMLLIGQQEAKLSTKSNQII